MAKWTVIKRIYSPSKNRYYETGETVELDDATAAVLLKINRIKPAMLNPDPVKTGQPVRKKTR